MPRFGRREVSIEEAAVILRVQPETIRRRLRSRELSGSRVDGRELVVLEPGHTWLRVEDAAALLGVTSATVRGSIRRGELAGRREKQGRYRVRLESVLRDRRCDGRVAGFFRGDEVPPEPEQEAPPPRPRAHRLRRDFHVALDEEELELLELHRDRHGSFREVIVAGLRAIPVDGLSSDEIAELRVAHDSYREQAERATAAARELSERLRLRPVDEIACVACERLVPISEVEFIRRADGSVVLMHAKHGRDLRGRARKGSVLAVQQLGELES